MRRGLLSIGIGAILEVIFFFSLVPKDSMQPLTTWQTVGEQMLIPFASLVGLLSHILNVIPIAPSLNRRFPNFRRGVPHSGGSVWFADLAFGILCSANQQHTRNF